MFTNTSNAALLKIVDLSKTFDGPSGGVQALKGISLTIARGEFMAVRGPSGCGKSTLLHIAGAMDRASSGTVCLGNRTLNDLSLAELARLRRRQIGFVFQGFNLLPTLTVLDNVMLPLLLDGADPRAAGQRAAALLEQVGLSPRAAHFPAQLSGGEAQRAALARAVVAEPDLLLADEPTGSLDSESGARVMRLLADLNRELRVTILLATHSAEIAAYAGRALFLRDGRVERVETA